MTGSSSLINLSEAQEVVLKLTLQTVLSHLNPFVEAEFNLGVKQYFNYSVFWSDLSFRELGVEEVYNVIQTGLDFELFEISIQLE